MPRSQLSAGLSLSVMRRSLVAAQAVTRLHTPGDHAQLGLGSPTRVLDPPRSTRGDSRHWGGTSRRASCAQPHAGD